MVGLGVGERGDRVGDSTTEHRVVAVGIDPTLCLL
jgi:hypothetical protein